MTFSKTWFANSIAAMEEHVLPHRPTDLIEVGSLEGFSACWMLQAIPRANIVCVDPWSGDVDSGVRGTSAHEQLFDANVARFGDRVRKCKMRSSEYFRECKQHFDLIFVSGALDAKGVISDIVLAMPALRPRAFVIIDDYRGTSRFARVKATLAADFFAEAWDVDVLHRGWTMIARMR